MCKILYSKKYLLVLLIVLIIPGCAANEPIVTRNTAQWAEKKCITYDCFMGRLGKYRKEVSIDEKGHQVIRWNMSVSKIRPLGYGEEPRDGMYYRYYDEDCLFTAIFDQNGNVLETEWEGPGCWGDGH